ncbi:type I restriction endonuclease subunit R [Aliamphritea hakodatensis]|uniref:type I restriction endonuclease subunit R n=1 Tax=Aliamphritea hakodatensis TaxID=2895352 RepID=UPI0022FD6EE3|nr:type I restriction endonuclease subunit R [Aliamphritea hakodatensis]
MSTQSEAALEAELLKQLQQQSFELVSVTDEASLLANLKVQIEKLNDIQLSQNEFRQILNHLAKGSIFEKAKTLRDRFQFDKEDGSSGYVRFLHQDHDANQWQATQQVTVEGRYKNRYDVTILVNGLPLVQVELKRRGLEMKEAFNQIQRYQRHSYWASYGLFQYVQLFVISNGVNTKYYANNKNQSFKQTFFWTDEHGKRFTELDQFTEEFLTRQHLNKMFNQYIVLNETGRYLMAMRSYQIYATEAIVRQVTTTKDNGYIWHTTGSGKTLTSFKTAQILTASPDIDKVVFVVDRKDLDFQTSKEFNAFSKGCVDGTDKTKVLFNQFIDAPPPLDKDGNAINTQRNIKLIVTTIQKLNNVISHKRYTQKMAGVKDQRLVFIFDECHRSQFGDTHQRIVNFFNNHQMFGFTGTPIFAQNAHRKASRKYTTKDLFGECLHKYTIVDAIKDENVLKFGVEYVGRYKQKAGSKNALDIEVEGIDTKELLEDERRLEKITDYIIANHSRKTQSKSFTAMFCVSSVDVLIKYYELFQRKKEAGEHQLCIATIFSYAANEEDPDADGFLDNLDEAEALVGDGLTVQTHGVAEAAGVYAANSFTHSRDKLEQFIGDYNEMFGSSYTTKDSQSFYSYYNDISKKVKERKVDILLVVNMFLTGFDSPPLNTLYVDKNLKHHGLIQAYSRTNRILNEQKSQGNIISFRNLKTATDDALTLFSNKEAKETVIMPPYDDFVKLFNKAYGQLLAIAPDLDSVDDLADEEQELAFIQAFRELMRLRNILSSFADFDFDDVKIDEQEFEDYKSKYLDLYDKVKSNNVVEKESILNDVDFELELIHRDEINVLYITQLLAKLKGADKGKDYEYQYKAIMDLLGGTPELRSKQELIDQFIQSNLDNVQTPEQVSDAFEAYWEVEKLKALDGLCKEEKLIPDHIKSLVERMIHNNKDPLREEVVALMETPPTLLQRKALIPRVTEKLKGYIDTFYSGF